MIHRNGFYQPRPGEQTHFPVNTRRATFRSWPALDAKALQRYEDYMSLTRIYKILTPKNEINNKFACNLLIRTAKFDELAFPGNLFLYTLCISKMGSKNSLEKFWLIV